MNRHTKSMLCVPFLLTICAFTSGNNYKNFDVATYAKVRDVVQMKDPAYLESRWEGMSKYVKFDKIYLETSRDMIVADQASLDAGKKFFTCVNIGTPQERSSNETHILKPFLMAPRETNRDKS